MPAIKETRIMMDMPITVAIADGAFAPAAPAAAIEKVFSYFRYIDETFSIYKDASEISRINKGALRGEDTSEDVKTVLALCEKTKKESDGYFDIALPDGSRDPSGLVKGWAIRNAAKIINGAGFKDFYVDAGGDLEVRGRNAEGGAWRIGIRNPFNRKENVKILSLPHNEGVATSGTYIRGLHIRNPKNERAAVINIVSMTVIGPDIYEADRFATAAFAMGEKGIAFIEARAGLEGYMIDADGMATMTSGFKKYVLQSAAAGNNTTAAPVFDGGTDTDTRRIPKTISKAVQDKVRRPTFETASENIA